jgi:hypothetical protein
MNAIGSADPLGRPRALTALVVTIVTALVLITGSAWASPSGSERPSVDRFPEGFRVGERQLRRDSVRAESVAGARLGRVGRRSRSPLWPEGREKPRAFNSGGPSGGTEALMFDWPGAASPRAAVIEPLSTTHRRR